MSKKLDGVLQGKMIYEEMSHVEKSMSNKKGTNTRGRQSNVQKDNKPTMPRLQKKEKDNI